jgi:hypothetical protein
VNSVFSVVHESSGKAAALGFPPTRLACRQQVKTVSLPLEIGYLQGMTRFTIPLIGCLLLACSKGDDGAGGGEGGAAAACPAFELSVDGKPVTGVTHKLAFTHKRKDDRTHQVQWFNHDKATCAEVTATKGRVVPDGEVAVGAFAGGKGAFGKGVSLSYHTQLGVAVALVGPAPEKAGDKVSLCVPETTFKPTVGPDKDKSVTVKGLMEGSWCGFMDWDAK